MTSQCDYPRCSQHADPDPGGDGRFCYFHSKLTAGLLTHSRLSKDEAAKLQEAVDQQKRLRKAL